jgi:hypothetical protein
MEAKLLKIRSRAELVRADKTESGNKIITIIQLSR